MEDDNYTLLGEAPPNALESFNDSNNNNNNNDYYNFSNYFFNSNKINIQNKSKLPNYQYGLNSINEINKNKHSLKIDITLGKLKELKKDHLIDLLLFIKVFCEIFIDEKYINYNHDIFKIIKDVKNLNEYYIFAQNQEDINLNKNNIIDKIVNDENNIIEKNNDLNNNDIINDNSNEIIEEIINEEDKKYLKYAVKKYNRWFCTNHEILFKTFDNYKKHCKNIHAFLCSECGIYFGSLKSFKKHPCIKYILNGKEKKQLSVCLECDLVFKNANLMRIHYKNEHEKKSQEELKKMEEKKKEEELKKIEEKKKQEELKNLEEKKKRKN